MATSTLLQYLDSTDGSGNALGITASNRRQVERFIASASIKAGDMVCLDLTKANVGDQGLYITTANRSSGDTILAIGFALEAADANEDCNVTVAGLHESAAVKTGIATGGRLIAPDVGGGGTAGRAEEYTGAESVPVIGYCLKTAAANVANVFVIKQF